MDVISLMVRVSGLTSSSYSAPSCRGPPVTRPVEMRLYHHHTSHRVRCVRGHLKKKKKCGPHSFMHFLIALLLFPQFHFLSLTHTHTVHRWTQTATCLKTTRANLDSSGRGAGGGETTCLTSFSSNPVISTGSVQVIHSVFVVE